MQTPPPNPNKNLNRPPTESSTERLTTSPIESLSESLNERPHERPNDRLILLGLWLLLYASFTLFTPPLLDDADSVHAEVAREIVLRHDWITLYANGIRYLEKAPLLYWSMAASFKLFGVHEFAARIPLALAVLALAFLLRAFARQAFQSARAGLYAALILLSSFGIFIFTRITIPDAAVCLWLALALYVFWRTEQESKPALRLCLLFAAACALNVLTKGLIGLLFPAATVLAHLLLTRGLRGTVRRLRQFHPITSTLAFLAIAAPWHILIALANPAQGHPGALSFHHGHWQVPLPTDGNVHGWAWFYFVNEHLLRYLNLRVPRDYDTVPLYLFWGLLFVWIMPWSAFLLQSLAAIELRAALVASPLFRNLNWLQLRLNPTRAVAILTPRESTLLLLGLWAATPLLFFSLSTRQEYYVLPSIPAFALLIAAWLDEEVSEAESFIVPNPRVLAGQRISVVLLAFGSVAALAAGFLALHAMPPAPNADLAALLHQNPAAYALSFGHFLDLNAQAMGAFRQPLLLTAAALFVATLANFLGRRAYQPHVGNLWLTAGSVAFLLAAHIGLQTFSPVLTSQQLAATLAPLLKPTGSRFPDLIVIHGEYEAASTLGFYLQRPTAFNDSVMQNPSSPNAAAPTNAVGQAQEPIHLLNGRSSNLWYGSFFPDAPPIFEDDTSLALKWSGSRRIFLWQDLSQPLPPLPGKTFFITQSGGKEILSNQPNPF